MIRIGRMGGVGGVGGVRGVRGVMPRKNPPNSARDEVENEREMEGRNGKVGEIVSIQYRRRATREESCKQAPDSA